MAQRRAKKGGEVGANGEWYEGGKWIANTDASKRAGYRRPTGRQPIAPGEFAVPEAGKFSLFQRWSSVWIRDEDGSMRCRDDLPIEYWGREYLDQAQQMADRWNAGERWVDA